jgi:hypothetical protein
MPLDDSVEVTLDLYTLYADRFIKLKRISESEGWVGANEWIRFYRGQSEPFAGSMSSAGSIINDGVVEISGDVVLNESLVDRGEFTVLGNLVEKADIDIIALPDAPDCEPYRQDLEVKKGKTEQLSSGSYCYDALVLGKGSTLIVEPPITLVILDDMFVNKNARILLSTGSSIDVIVWYSGESDVIFGSWAQIWGTYIAPSAHMTFQDNSSLIGALYAEIIQFEAGSSFQSHP